MSLFFDLHLLEKRESRTFMHSPSFGMLMEYDPTLFLCLLHAVSSFLKNSKFIQSSVFSRFKQILCLFDMLSYHFLLCTRTFSNLISSAVSCIPIANIIRTKNFCLFFLSIRFRLVHNFWLLPSLRFKNTINILFLPYQAID